MSSMYNQGSRQLQAQFDSQRIADRLEQRTVHEAFTDKDRAFIERSSMFFLETLTLDIQLITDFSTQLLLTTITRSG